jgi:hypothetical protein
MPNKVQDLTSNAGATKIAIQKAIKEESEIHGASLATNTGCKTWEERDDCAIFANLEVGVQCPKCKYWTKNSGPSD